MKTRITTAIIALAGILALNVACQREDYLLPEAPGTQDGT